MTNDFRHDMHRNPAELEQEADRARADLEHTLEALEQRLSPGQLLDQALNLVRSDGDGFAHNLSIQVRNNPVPVLLTGIGLTWLAATSNRSAQTTGGASAGERTSGAASKAGGAASGAAASARSAAHGAREAGGSATDRTREAMSNMAGATRHAAEDMANAVTHASSAGARRFTEGYDYLRREQPLVLGALAVAAGAAVGALLPSTARENEWMGEQSREARDRLKEEGRARTEEAKSAAADAAQAAKEAAEPRRVERERPSSGAGDAVTGSD